MKNNSNSAREAGLMITTVIWLRSEGQSRIGGKQWSHQCNVLKLPPRATLTQSIFNSTKLPNPEV